MPSTRRLFVHVGLQKTGTSYLQGVLRANIDEVAAQGLDLVPRDLRDSFELMLLVRGRYNPERDPASAAGALDRFSEQLAASPGPGALLSQESLAAARPTQIRRLLGACEDREVHVVATVRDLARGLPSSWQQELKSAKTDRYDEYLQRLRDSQEAGAGTHPWIHLDPPAVLARWAEHVPPDRIHVVTVPPAGSTPSLLLERFCGVLGLASERLLPEERPANTSLGLVQAEVLRRVNAELPEEMRRRQVYGDVGKRFFAAQVLSAQVKRPILVPEAFREWCLEVTEQQIAALETAGYAVHGSLDDLRARDDGFADQVDEARDSEVAAAAVTALAEVLTRRGESRRGRGGRRPGAGVLGRVRARLSGA